MKLCFPRFLSNLSSIPAWGRVLEHSRLRVGLTDHPEMRKAYVENIGDHFVIRDALGLSLFDQRFEFCECQSANFFSGGLLVLLGLTVAIDGASGRLETQCVLQCDRVPSDSAKFQVLGWVDGTT